jgi:hypothetical protein
LAAWDGNRLTPTLAAHGEIELARLDRGQAAFRLAGIRRRMLAVKTPARGGAILVGDGRPDRPSEGGELSQVRIGR